MSYKWWSIKPSKMWRTGKPTWAKWSFKTHCSLKRTKTSIETWRGTSSSFSRRWTRPPRSSKRCTSNIHKSEKQSNFCSKSSKENNQNLSVNLQRTSTRSTICRGHCRRSMLTLGRTSRSWMGLRCRIRSGNNWCSNFKFNEYRAKRA